MDDPKNMIRPINDNFKNAATATSIDKDFILTYCNGKSNRTSLSAHNVSAIAAIEYKMRDLRVGRNAAGRQLKFLLHEKPRVPRFVNNKIIEI